MPGKRKVIPIGISETSWTNVVPGTVANTKGPWFELDGSLSDSITGLCLHVIGPGDSTISDSDLLIDIGVGSAGAEAVVIPDLRSASDAGKDDFFESQLGYYDISIPSGSRVSVRFQSTLAGTDSNADMDIGSVGIAI